MSTFVFKDYRFDEQSATATFHYGFDDGTEYEEKVTFKDVKPGYNAEVLDRALFLSFILAGTSYFKTFPTPNVVFEKGGLDDWQAEFLNAVYQEGLSQFAFENTLRRQDLAQFSAVGTPLQATAYDGEGVIALQSGGKDSLLTASLLNEKSTGFTSWYIANSAHYPALLDTLGAPLRTALRVIDREKLIDASSRGGRNGHVPVTYIVASYALIDAVLHGSNTLLLSIGHEGEEPHDWIDDLPVNHQWSKTWPAEQKFAEYVRRYLSPDIRIGSPLRSFSELKIAELFVAHAWEKYGHTFSSCNRANYMQGADNTQLKWCGECPKCANSFILFAPFLPAEELKSLFNGQDLFEKPLLTETFKGLLGIDGVMKPFECVGETDELRRAYHMAMARGGYKPVPFDVPDSDFDYEKRYDSQGWANEMVQ